MEHLEETKFLAYLIHDDKYITKILNRITPQHLPNVFKTYNLISKYYAKYQTVLQQDTLQIFFEKRKTDSSLRAQILNDYSDALHVQCNFTDGDFESIVDFLEENYKRRQMLSLAEDIVNNNVNTCSAEELNKIFDKVQKVALTTQAQSSNVRDEGNIKDNIKERIERYEQIKANPDMLTTYNTGFKKIDDVSGGFAPGELIYIIGRQGTGKSVLMLNFAHNFWKNGLNVILFSIEISKDDYMRRFDACAAGISSNGLKRGSLTPIEEDVYHQYLNKVAEGLSLDGKKIGSLYIVDVPSNCTPAFIESKVKEVEAQEKVTYQIVISDYAGIMQPNVQMGELRHNKSQIAWELKQLARKYNKVVISGEQMNRVGKNQKKTENDAVAESDGVTNHIDWGIALRQNNDQDTITIETFKTRDAGALDFTCRKKFDKMQLEELQDIQEWDL